VFADTAGPKAKVVVVRVDFAQQTRDETGCQKLVRNAV
jgi:hypothetical protein